MGHGERKTLRTAVRQTSIPVGDISGSLRHKMMGGTCHHNVIREEKTFALSVGMV
jgi:hypothetical protein